MRLLTARCSDERMMHAWDQQWPRLRRADVFPFPLATETNYAAEGWLVHLVVLAEAAGGWYACSLVASYTKPYGRDAFGWIDQSPEAANAVTEEAVAFFADRLRSALNRDDSAQPA